MSKENISATVDPVVAEYLRQDTVNCSGVVNRAVKREMGILDEEDTTMLEFRLEQVQEEREDLEARAERKATIEAQLEQQLNQTEKQQQSLQEEVIENAVDGFAYLPEKDAEVVEKLAKDANMDVDAFYERLTEAWDDA